MLRERDCDGINYDHDGTVHRANHTSHDPSEYNTEPYTSDHDTEPDSCAPSVRGISVRSFTDFESVVWVV